MTKVHVVMGNDYPDAVFAAEDMAEIYVETKKLEEVARKKRDRFCTPIHWHSYDFELIEDPRAAGPARRWLAGLLRGLGRRLRSTAERGRG